jgi:hypothetical protein
MESYDEHALRTKVDAALRRIRTVLDNTRNPQYAADVPHRYDDKYFLAEVAARVSIASLLQCFEIIGMSHAQLEQLCEWAKTRSVSIRLSAEEHCSFVREQTRKVESAEERVTETRGLLGNKVTKTEKVVTNVTEYFWRFDFAYKLVAFQGTSIEQAITIHSRAGSIEIKTGAKTTPRPQAVARPWLDVNVTWLVSHLDADSKPSFAIDRTKTSCHTPRRNDEIDRALRELDELHAWCTSASSYFLNELFPAQQDHGIDLSAINDANVFVPVLPLFEGNRVGPTADGDDAVVPVAFVNAFLAEERRSLVEKRRELDTTLPKDASVITSVEAGLVVTLLHARQVCQAFANSVAYIEDMLRKQLIAAIGKEVTPADFNGYMEFHHRKLVRPEYRPRPFSYAIRRPDHYPEGILSIEDARAGAMPDAISTIVARSEARRAMSFALDASTRVSFGGERFLHAFIAHQFSGAAAPALELVARARQFSSFILLVGRIASADAFEPRFGIIVDNKDLVKIPLMLEQIPTPKEFRDAIESLSPEQQRFARAFRGMQLESTLFGVCVIQIKPQLEKLLKLPPDSLTKEIKMTQELLDLFIEYQIPSDLLSYDGPADAPTELKLARVKDYVAKMQEMIDLSKKKQLEEERAREALRLAEQNRTPVAPMPVAFAAGPIPAPSMQMIRTGAAPSPPRMMAESRSAPLPAAPPPVAAPPPPAAPPPAALLSQQSTQQPMQTAQPVRPHSPDAQSASPLGADGDGDVDYTRIPSALDKKLEALDDDGALRATIINPGDTWTRSAQKGLLGAAEVATLRAAEQKTEKDRAFDLLDALSKSGALSIDDASLHVLVAATHCFDKTLLDTVIQGNVNPVERVERSLMIVGTTIHGRPAGELLADDQRDRFFATSPRLGPGAGGGEG